MSFHRIKSHFTELGRPNPKGIFVHDPDKNYEDGLYVIVDEESCRRTLRYVEIISNEEIELFVDDDRESLPDDITPSSLSIGTDESIEERVNLEEAVGERETQREEVRVNLSTEMADDIVTEMRDEREEIPTQCSRPNRVERAYVSPMNYISEDEDGSDGSKDEEDGSEDEASDGEDEACEDVPNSDPVVRGPIANEREIRCAKMQQRSITFPRGESSEVRHPTNLPFKAPGLQWKGTPSITTRQLLDEGQLRRSKRSRLGGEESGSTDLGQP